MGSGSAHESKRRIEFIHLLRGIAPLLVVWSHLPGWWLAERQWSWPPFDWYARYVVTPLRLYQNGGHLGVVLFFIISGFIISHMALRERRFEFAVKRVLRIWPALLVALLAMFVAQWLAARLQTDPLTGHYHAATRLDYLVNATLLNWVLPQSTYALSVTWSLLPEVVFYALVLAILPLMKARPIRSSVVLLVLALLLANLWRYPPLESASVAVISAPIFLVGRAFYLFWSRQTTWWVSLLIGIIALAGYFGAQENRSPGITRELISSYAIAICMFMAAMALMQRNVPKLLGFSADISYSLYLLHMPVGIVVLNILKLYGCPIDAAIPLALGAAIAAAYLCNIWVEKPMQMAARQLVESDRLFATRLRGDRRA
jgi:peptidoglycan/LPS O-acetylase OafA/YrhL